MKKIALLSLFILICACAMAQAQIINYVKNPSFEDTVKCPYQNNQISLAKYWHCAVDTIGEPLYAAEYFNACAGSAPPSSHGMPENAAGYQYARTGNGMIGMILFYDKTLPALSGVPFNYRDYVQSLLQKKLTAGKTYCVSYWVNVVELSGYAINKIGAYFDNGSINTHSPAGTEITDVVPQVYSTTIIKDTMNWTKIEGSFVATGNETHITLGNFAKNSDVDTAFLFWGGLYQHSYYLFDDISVIPIDLPADAGLDNWVELGKQVKIGRVGDTTAMGLDCKWYRKGVLIDSGAVITVNANAIKHAIDTYVVVQTICGIVKRDTVTVFTAGLGLNEIGFDNKFMIYPNPSNGNITITSSIETNQAITTKVYDLLGRELYRQKLSFSNKQATLKMDIPNGTYIIELKDEEGNVQRERIVIE
jgi:hypothetical protein